jgi:hypothetical protein
MRVQRTEHPVDRGFDQLCLVNLFHICRPHPFENVAEQIKLAIDISRSALLSAQRGADLGCKDSSRDQADRTGHNNISPNTSVFTSHHMPVLSIHETRM